MLKKTGAEKKPMTDSEKKIRMLIYHDAFSGKEALENSKKRGTTLVSIDQQTGSFIKDAKYYEHARGKEKSLIVECYPIIARNIFLLHIHIYVVYIIAYNYEYTIYFLCTLYIDFDNTILSTYKNNPTPLSVDLIQAMLRYRDFISTVVTKIIPKWDDPLAEIPNLIKEYYDFLILLKKTQETNNNNSDSLTTILPSWTAGNKMLLIDIYSFKCILL